MARLKVNADTSRHLSCSPAPPPPLQIRVGEHRHPVAHTRHTWEGLGQHAPDCIDSPGMTVSNSAVSFMDATIHPPHSWLSQHWPWDGLQNGARAEVTSPEAPSGVTASHHIDAFGKQRSDFVCDIVCGCVWLDVELSSGAPSLSSGFTCREHRSQSNFRQKSHSGHWLSAVTSCHCACHCL